jgi:hypothetical protein
MGKPESFTTHTSLNDLPAPVQARLVFVSYLTAQERALPLFLDGQQALMACSNCKHFTESQAHLLTFRNLMMKGKNVLWYHAS